MTRQSDVGGSQGRVLMAVADMIEAGQGPITADRIGERAGISVDEAREAVAGLYDRGLVSTRDTSQQRHMRVAGITTAGHMELRRIG